MAERSTPLGQMSGMMTDELRALIERTIQQAIEPLQARIEELERRVDELQQGSQLSEAEGGEL